MLGLTPFTMRSALIVLLLLALPAHGFAQRGKWIRIGTHNSPPAVRQIIAGPDRTVYLIGTKGEVYESTDGCENWSVLSGVPGSERITQFWVSPTGYLLGKSDTAYYWTRDNDYWTLVPHYDTLFVHANPECAAIDNNGTPYFGVSFKCIYRLKDDATGFARVAYVSNRYDLKDIAFDRANRLYTFSDSIIRFNAAFQAEKKWVYRAQSRDKLYRIGNGMLLIGDSIRILEPRFQATADNSTPHEYIVDSAGSLLYLDGGQLVKSTDFGSTWQRSGPFPLGYGYPAAATRRGLVSQDPSATMAISVDSEKSFHEFQAFNDQLTFYAIFVDRKGTIHAFDSLDGHWTSTDGGRYWSLAKQERSYPIDPDYPPFAGDDGTVYMPTTRLIGSMIFRELVASEDNCATFHLLPHPSLPGAINYNVFPTGNRELYSYSDTHIISHSTDNGATWIDIGDFVDSNNPYIQKNPEQIVGFVRHGPILWAASENTLFYTTNAGSLWLLQPSAKPGEDIGWGSYRALWSALDNSVLVSMGSSGFLWLSLKEHFSHDSWVQCDGPVVQSGDSDVLGIFTYRSDPFYLDELIHMHRGHSLFDTIVWGPDSLSIHGMALDSNGNLYGIGYPSKSHRIGSKGLRGIYKLSRTGSDVKLTMYASDSMEVHVENGRIVVTAAREFGDIDVVSVLGKPIGCSPSGAEREWMSDRVSPGLYIVRVRWPNSVSVQKIIVQR